MSKALLTAETEIEIPFHDCDPMQVVWHGNYARYFEVARCALLRRFDYDYMQMHDSGYLWPIVDLRVKYIASARFAQRIRVQASLVEYLNRLRIDYLITDVETGQKITKGYSIQVAVEMQTKEMQFDSPNALIDRVEACL
ncbi:thioesterase family protein [Lacimicrobium sp. SS2-24]|uniref:acyl-CoA thioesterase n=1 Tax=Lacimicrobium sp. SS2-24 TaxID=2005569 RepID=UPI000B4B750D|nr:thioesterase family protein [Lacimicrobium sp. SS2-24]